VAAAIASSVKASVEIMDSVGDKLVAARSILGEVDNNTSYSFTVSSKHHDHGGFKEAPDVLRPKAPMVFGSISKGFLTGTEGRVTFRSTGDNLDLTVFWNNPYVGNNKCSAKLSGAEAFKYRVIALCGSGNKKAHMRYILYPLAWYNQRFDKASELSEQAGVAPGTPKNDVHAWNKIVLRDYVNGSWGNGAIIWSEQATGVDPHYVGGGEWAAYTRAVRQHKVSPGYPINLAHNWNRVRIQDFDGGEWGRGALIGGAHAELVAGGFWKAYTHANGSNSLRNPKSFVVERRVAGKTWNVQYLDGGVIWQRKGSLRVRFYDTKKWLEL
jgi:hypothetical protein